MSQFVLDASVVLTWCFPDEKADLAHYVADRFKHGDSAIAPDFWPHEVLNALLSAEKRKRISQQMIGKFLADLALLPVELKQVPGETIFDRIQALSRQYGLTAYNAAYLALAIDSGLPVASVDEELVSACARAGVGLLHP